MAYLKIYTNWLPYAKMTDKRGFISKRYGNGHTGVDSVGNVYGNEVCAVMNGYVTKVYYSATLGNVVEYGAGNVRFALYHLAKVHASVGTAVKAGETILGIEGSTGSLSVGKHLHTSMWINDALVNPEPYLCGEKMIPTTEGEGNKMTYQVGDTVYVSGKIAPSAYSTDGTVTREDALTISKFYPGTNFPYAVAVNGTVVGFARATDMVHAEGSQLAALEQENNHLRKEIARVNAMLEAARNALAE